MKWFWSLYFLKWLQIKSEVTSKCLGLLCQENSQDYRIKLFYDAARPTACSGQSIVALPTIGRKINSLNCAQQKGAPGGLPDPAGDPTLASEL